MPCPSRRKRRRSSAPSKVSFSSLQTFQKKKMTNSNETITLIFSDDSEILADMSGDEDEEEMLKRAIAMSLEEQ